MSSTSPFAQPTNLGSPPITIVLTIILLVCFFVGFFSIYFCRCFLDSIVSSWNLRRTPSGNLVNPDNHQENLGLDPSLIQIFPTFSYSSVKNFRKEKYGLECAICLAEFDDDDMLRLLTVCYHVFHQECIDLWLGSHKTCPVCRQDLDLPRETLEKTMNNENQDKDNDNNNNNNNNASALIEHAIRIAIRESNSGELGRKEVSNNLNNTNGEGIITINEDPESGQKLKSMVRFSKMERFSRSHSTGHSIVASGRGKVEKEEDDEDQDKYTLRFKDHVKVKITRGHNTAESCITFGDFSSPKNGGLGEVGGCSGEGFNQV